MKKQIKFWGASSKKIDLRFDPLQTYFESGTRIGHKIIISKIRDKRPVENKKKPSNEVPDNRNSIFLKIIDGEEKAILVSTDKKFILNPFNNQYTAKLLKIDKENAICCLNKYSIFSRFSDEGRGIMLVAFPVKSLLFLYEDHNALANTLLSLKIAILNLLNSSFKLTTFFNIGAGSGSTISQLHLQSYIYNSKDKGSLELILEKSQEHHLTKGYCLLCKIVNRSKSKNKETDISENLVNQQLVIYEDKFIQIRLAYAPLRFSQLRIIVKEHINHIGRMSDKSVKALGKAISMSDFVIMKNYKIKGKLKNTDRSVAFRQFQSSRFHMFIDVFTTHAPFGGPELTIPLTSHSTSPEELVSNSKKAVAEFLQDYL